MSRAFHTEGFLSHNTAPLYSCPRPYSSELTVRLNTPNRVTSETRSVTVRLSGRFISFLMISSRVRCASPTWVLYGFLRGKLSWRMTESRLNLSKAFFKINNLLFLDLLHSLYFWCPMRSLCFLEFGINIDTSNSIAFDNSIVLPQSVLSARAKCYLSRSDS